MSTSNDFLWLENKRVMATYLIGRNVMMQYFQQEPNPAIQPLRVERVVFGTITGYQLNSVGEMCLVIRPVSSSNEVPPLLVLNPSNSTFKITDL